MTENPSSEGFPLESWLDKARIEHYLCGECEGLHLPVLQKLEAVVNSRVFQQSFGLVVSTELEIRPVAILPLAADLCRLNLDYPTLKIFVDVVDDATPQLVISATQLTGGSLTQAQFDDFMATSMEATRHLAEECLRLDYLFVEDDSVGRDASRSLH